MSHDVIRDAEVESVHAEHTPLYSWAPLIIAVGVFCLNAGFVFGPPVAALGLLVFLAGVVAWIRQDVRLWAHGSDDDGGH